MGPRGGGSARALLLVAPSLLLLLLLLVSRPHPAAAFLRPSSSGSSRAITTTAPALSRQESPRAPAAAAGNNSNERRSTSKKQGPPLTPQPPTVRPAWPRPRSPAAAPSSTPTKGAAKPTSSKPPARGAGAGSGLLRKAQPTSAASAKAKQQPPASQKKKAAPKKPDPQVFPQSILPPKVKPTRLIISEPKQGLWVFEQPFVLGVTDVRNRMSVLRLSDGGFAVFSPLAATPECVEQLLGLIRKEKLKLASAYFIAPSSYPEHHESLAAWREAIPEARIVSVTARVNVIVEYLLEGEQPLANLPSILAKDLDMGLLQAPLLRELIVCHKASRTLFVADSGFYISEAYVDSALQRWFTKSQGIYDRFVTPPFFRLGANLKTGRPLYQRALGWDFDRIVTCHADLVPMGQGKEAFREGYAHLK